MKKKYVSPQSHLNKLENYCEGDALQIGGSPSFSKEEEVLSKDRGVDFAEEDDFWSSKGF